jgi:nucleoid-associated protein YgaU
VSIAITLAIVIGTWGLFRESLDLALDAVPRGLDPQAVTDLLAGIPGVSEVHDNIAVATPEPEAEFYEVAKGDTLSKIAKQFYGDANKYNVIFEANKPMLSNPDRIYPGQKLRIPAL